ncbi:MAG: cytochrome c [Haliea sp.]|jgi:cytochrome c556|nr:cytochrome c [Haliea sp.]
MPRSLRKYMLAATAVTGLALAPLAVSHLNDKEVQQSYRQSWFTLVALNFGPMASTVKGEIPWNDDMMKGWANDLATLTTLNIMRGFGEGSDKGTTRAKPEIWQNKADFESKMNDLKTATAALQEATAGGDRKAIAEAVGAAGEACKACHDEYKSKDYLY